MLIAFVNNNGVKGVLLHGVSGDFQSGEVLTGGTSGATATSSAGPVDCWAYRPQSDPELMKTITHERYMSGSKFPGLGTMGTFSLAMEVGQRGVMEFILSARYVRPTEVTQPTPTLSDDLAPTIKGLGAGHRQLRARGRDVAGIRDGQRRGRDQGRERGGRHPANTQFRLACRVRPWTRWPTA